MRVGASAVWPGQCGDRAVPAGAAGEALRVSSDKLRHSAQPSDAIPEGDASEPLWASSDIEYTLFSVCVLT